jgi:hypothetical protein
MDQPPRGKLFSEVYIERGQPTQDSLRMRRRIGELIHEFRPLEENLPAAVRQRLGIFVQHHPHWPGFLEKAELKDVLSLVTVAYRLLRAGDARGGMTMLWLRSVQTIYQEENVHYRVDDEGGVRFHFDEEFAHNRASAIATLQPARYANALHAFESGMTELRKTPPNGKGAVRGVFAAAEAIFKLITTARRLGASELEGLGPKLHRHYARDETARNAATKMLNSFKDWVDAAHFYRHEAGKPDEIVQPPLELAVYLVSTGASHVRWLAELDATLQN